MILAYADDIDMVGGSIIKINRWNGWKGKPKKVELKINEDKTKPMHIREETDLARM